jgi:hypothetical protein
MRYEVILISAVGVACIAAGLSGCTSVEEKALSAQFSNHNCKPKDGRKLYVYGDSVSHGWDVPSYPGIVACRLGLELVNASIGGTSIESNNQYPKIMGDSWESDAVVMFAPGVNDAILYDLDPVHLALYELSLVNILNKALVSGNLFILGTAVNSCDEERFEPNSTKQVYADLNRKLHAAAGSDRIHLADYGALFAPSRSNTHDCLHPNPTGNYELAEIALGAF